jgi:outer membrane biosynthesis protein TonB
MSAARRQKKTKKKKKKKKTKKQKKKKKTKKKKKKNKKTPTTTTKNKNKKQNQKKKPHRKLVERLLYGALTGTAQLSSNASTIFPTCDRLLVCARQAPGEEQECPHVPQEGGRCNIKN